jgi:peptide/nickel transport system substrate-binding protein
MQNFNKENGVFKLPNKKEVRWVFTNFSKKEWIVFFVFLLLLLISTLGILNKLNKSFTVSVPLKGGSFNEGVVGTPRFVNPILAISDADQDVTSLVYSGLMRKNTDGTLSPDLAQSYSVSENGLEYTFTLKDKIRFHNGEKVTIEDIIFTIEATQDPLVKSPQKSKWENIQTEKVDDKTIKFTLPKPNSAFMLNTTIGIMPSSIWKNSAFELNDANTNPIGTGPYKVASFKKTNSGLIESYTLKYFKDFTLQRPYIKEITLKFYPNENDLISAFNAGKVDQISSISPENTQKIKSSNNTKNNSTLPRVFALFFNYNEASIFTNKNVIEAINKAINKEQIIDEVLLGYGISINQPIPPSVATYQIINNKNTETNTDQIAEAIQILEKDGFKMGEDGIFSKTTTDSNKRTTNTSLAFSISTGNAPELVKTAEIIKENLRQIGVDVTIRTFETGNLNQEVIRPRKFEALLFGQIVNHESDLYAFWHSSQRKDPGLNIAMYANTKVDKLLEEATVTIDEKERTKKYVEFEQEIQKDKPAVFLYSPNFIYITSKKINGINLGQISSTSDRFLNIHSWYIKTDNVWKIFTK